MVHVMPADRLEALGPAEHILQTLLTVSDHMTHNRPGVVVEDAGSPTGVRWSPATVRAGAVYRLDKVRKRTVRVKLGRLQEDGVTIHDEAGVRIGEYRKPGLFPEVAAWLYEQAIAVWKLDNAFAAHWASWSFAGEHRDLKVVLAALMLVQSRCGEPVREGDEILFHDDDFREVGEAMCLLRRRDGRDLNPRLLLRVGALLELPQVARLNRELGFGGRSLRSAPLGRWPRVVTRWLRHRERNPRMLEGLVRAGFRQTVMQLCRKVGYKPESARFFEILRWKQSQAADGRRALVIGRPVAEAETWAGLSEREICERIVATKPSYKRLVGMLPPDVGLTRAIMAASLEAGGISNTELVILTPTLEELGLLEITEIADRWTRACEAAESMRAAHIAERVRSQQLAERLQDAADGALQKAVEESTQGLRVYCAVDISGSMGTSLDRAKNYLSQFLQGFPLEKLCVAVFNSSAREVTIRHASARGVEHAFRSFAAGGGTSHGSAFREVFCNHLPASDEDALCLFVGDQEEYGDFVEAVRSSGLNPVAFGFLDIGRQNGMRAVEQTAAALGIPCFPIHEAMFGDAYAVSRTLRHLIASTPVSKDRIGKPQRQDLVATILATPLLSRPVWV